MKETKTQKELPILSPEQKLTVKHGPDKLRIMGMKIQPQICECIHWIWTKIEVEHVGAAVVGSFSQLIQGLMLSSLKNSTFDPKNPNQPEIEKVANSYMPFAWETLITDQIKALAHELGIDVQGTSKGFES